MIIVRQSTIIAGLFLVKVTIHAVGSFEAQVLVEEGAPVICISQLLFLLSQLDIPHLIVIALLSLVHTFSHLSLCDSHLKWNINIFFVFVNFFKLPIEYLQRDHFTVAPSAEGASNVWHLILELSVLNVTINMDHIFLWLCILAVNLISDLFNFVFGEDRI